MHLKQIECDRVPKEIAFLLLLKHKYIIETLDYFTDEQIWYIVMEKPEGYEDLGQLVRRSKFLDEDLSRTIFRNLVETIQYCHSMGVLHRDIKGRNILVHPKTGDIKLIDFGCAVSFSTTKYSTCSGKSEK